MMSPDDLFLCTVEDLEDRMSRVRPVELAGRLQQYELVMVASLLRKLLLDGGSLVGLVNRGRHLRLTYPVSGWPFTSVTAVPTARVSMRLRRSVATVDVPVIPENLPPELARIVRRRHLTLDQMLAEPVVRWNDVAITAQGLISYVANVGGGVHLGGQPKGQVQTALHTFGEQLIVDGFPVALAGVWDVGRVALAGIEPLRAAVQAPGLPARPAT